MVFSDLDFLYFFLPLVLILYFPCKNLVWRNSVLLVFSLVFYAWGEPKRIALMLLASLVAYLGGLLIEKFKTDGKKSACRAVFVATTVLLILNLFVFKYLNFAVDNINLLLSRDITIPQILLPIGISFYTFQILSYVFDLYLGNVKVQKNYFYLTLYVSFFPQLIAGPIVRYQTVEEEIHERSTNIESFAHGLRRFIRGLAKKILLANNVAVICETVYAGEVQVFGTAFYWLAAVAHSLQLYFDFSGYSDMAIGLGEIFGFHFLENFDHPYISCSVTEFWRRWHISLSTWFRDYIYIPMGGNRVGKVRHIINIMTVWALTGFWHGAQWNFIIWGIYYGVLLLVEKFLLGKLLKKLPKIFGWIYTMFFVIIGWVLFNLTDFSKLAMAIKTMFSAVPTDLAAIMTAHSDKLFELCFIPVALIFMLPIRKRFDKFSGTGATIVANLVHLLLFAVCIIFSISSSYNPFIYFRF